MAYKPSELAQMLSVSVSTVRNWTSDYAEHLSPAARGETGDRQYSERDVSVLKYIAQLRSEKQSRNVIALRLRETHFGESETLVQPIQQATGTPTDATEDVSGTTHALALAQFVESRLDASQRATDERLAILERTQSTGVRMLLYGVAIGFGMAILLLAIASVLQL